MNMYLRREHFARTRFTASTVGPRTLDGEGHATHLWSWTRPVAALIMVRDARSYGEVS